MRHHESGREQTFVSCETWQKCDRCEKCEKGPEDHLHGHHGCHVRSSSVFARGKYMGHGWVTTFHSILWGAIKYPCRTYWWHQNTKRYSSKNWFWTFSESLGYIFHGNKLDFCWQFRQDSTKIAHGKVQLSTSPKFSLCADLVRYNPSDHTYRGKKMTLCNLKNYRRKTPSLRTFAVVGDCSLGIYGPDICNSFYIIF